MGFIFDSLKMINHSGVKTPEKNIINTPELSSTPKKKVIRRNVITKYGSCVRVLFPEDD